MNKIRHILAGTAIWLLSASFAVADPQTAVDPLPASTDEMPWYRSFTLRSADVNDGAFLPLKEPDVEIRASSQWGITVGLEERDPVLESPDRMSAGAFFDITPRIRVGGGFTFTAPEDLRFSTPNDRVYPIGPVDEKPVVRVESSIKF